MTLHKHDGMCFLFGGYVVETLHVCITKQEASYYELDFVSKLNTCHPYGYNLRGGGFWNYHHSDDTKIKIGERKTTNQGKYARSPEWRMAASERAREQMRENHPSLGMKHTNESRKKMSEKRLMNPANGKAWTGRKHSEENKRKMSETKRHKRLEST